VGGIPALPNFVGSLLFARTPFAYLRQRWILPLAASVPLHAQITLKLPQGRVGPVQQYLLTDLLT